MTDIHDADGRVVEVYASGGKYSIVTFDENGPRVIELDRDEALKFAHDLLIATLDALND